MPVVYLLQIDLDTEGTWSTIGYAERIADDLVANGQARRAILAMLTGNQDNLPTEL